MRASGNECQARPSAPTFITFTNNIATFTAKPVTEVIVRAPATTAGAASMNVVNIMNIALPGCGTRAEAALANATARDQQHLLGELPPLRRLAS